MGRTYRIRTLGCKANLSDSQLLESNLQREGFSAAGPDEVPDLVIVNSCTVTNEADKQSRKAAEHAARDFPNATVVLTGCGAEVNPKAYAQTPGLRYVVPNRKKTEWIQEIASNFSGTVDTEVKILGDVVGYEEFSSRHPMDREWPLPEAVGEAPARLDPTQVYTHSSETSARTRAFLKVQEGCNAFCTYCVIPYGRGPSRSLPPSALLERVRTLVDQGVREIVLTATNLGEYGVDLSLGGEPMLEYLVERILAGSGVERLRLSSLDAREISDRLISIMETESRLCAHVHFSLQNIDSHILKRMKRKYSGDDAIAKLHQLAQAQVSAPGGVYVGMDYITGFPGETEESFEAQKTLLQELPWHRLHVFPYSEREGTPAVKLSGSVPMRERKRRSQVLNTLSLERGLEQGRRLIGKALAPVLLESRVQGPDGEKNWWSGYTSNYHRVWVREVGQTFRRHEIISVSARDILADRRNGDVILLSN